MNLEGGIWAVRLGFGPRRWDLRLEAGIWASRLGFWPRGCNLSFKARGGTEKEEEEEEKEKKEEVEEGRTCLLSCRVCGGWVGAG